MDFDQVNDTSFTSMLENETQPLTGNCNSKKVLAPKELNLGEKRGKNFDEEEDKLLVSAWLNTSLDPVNGNNMKGDRFWERIEMYYSEGKKGVGQKRSRNSLSHRWGIIQKAVNKFCGCLTQVENLQRSGATNEDNIQEARRLYSGLYNCSFRFDHCWDLLKDEEKWSTRDNLSGIKRKLPESSCNGSQEVVSLDEDDAPSVYKRPIGCKAAKESKKLGKNTRNDVSAGFASVLAELKDEKKKHHAEKIEKINISNEKKSEFLQIQKSQLFQAEEANRIQNEKLKLEQDREDSSIMMMDLSSLDPEQREYFRMRRVEITTRKYGNF